MNFSPADPVAHQATQPASGPPDQGRDARAAAQWRRGFITLCATQSIAMLAFGMALPFMPLYVQQLGVTDPISAARWAGAISSGGALVMAAVAPVWGSIADQYGRKPMVTRALFGGGAIVALMGFAQTPMQLVALRLVQGAFSGTVSATRTLVASVVPAAELGFALGIMQTSSFVGNSLGPLLGGLVADRFGFSVTFIVTGLLLVASGVACWRLVVEDFHRPAAPAAGTQTGWMAPLRLLMEVPGLMALIATMFFVQAGMSAVAPVLPLFVGSLLPADHGSVASLSGLILGATAVTSALSAGIAGRLGDRYGHERILTICAIGGGLLYLPQALARTPWDLLALRGVLGVFTGGLMPGVMVTIALRTPTERRGWVFGLTATATSLGNAAGPAVSAAAVTFFGLRATFVCTAAILTMAGVWVAAALRPPRPAPLPASTPRDGSCPA